MPCPGFGGELCAGHGLCDAATGQCACKEGWAGDDCAQHACAKLQCRNGGACRGETCYCPFGFTGEDCGQKLCPRGCSGRGVCAEGACQCPSGWAGEDCSEPSCPRGAGGALCSNKGGCLIDAIAETAPEHQARSPPSLLDPPPPPTRAPTHQPPTPIYRRASLPAAPTAHPPIPTPTPPRQQVYTCLCEEDATGEACEKARCPSDCSGHGACVDGTCYCVDGHSGPGCGVQPCSQGCSGHGGCVTGTCRCEAGWGGFACATKLCPGKGVCTGHGVCREVPPSLVEPSAAPLQLCACEAGWVGDDCSSQACENDCSGRGMCVDGGCFCPAGWEGKDCGVRGRPNRWAMHGACLPSGACACFDGWQGKDCAVSCADAAASGAPASEGTVRLSRGNPYAVQGGDRSLLAQQLEESSLEQHQQQGIARPLLEERR